MRYAFLLLLITLFPHLHIKGQETYYYAANTRPVDRMEEAVLMILLDQKSEKKYNLKAWQKNNYKWHEVDWWKIKIKKENLLRIRIGYNRFFPKTIYREITQIEPGAYQFVETHRGKTVREGISSRYLPLHLQGEVTEYYPNSSIKSVSTYVDNQLQSNRNWLPDGSPYIDSVFYSVEQGPEFIPGDVFFNSYLLQHLKDSKIDLNEIEDEVIIGWVVMETGDLEGVIPLQGRSKQMNQFLVETIAGIPGAWEPAVHDGRKVRFFMRIPINFLHDNVSFQDVELRGGLLLYNAY